MIKDKPATVISQCECHHVENNEFKLNWPIHSHAGAECKTVKLQRVLP